MAYEEYEQSKIRNETVPYGGEASKPEPIYTDAPNSVEWEGWPEGMETPRPEPEGDPIKIDLSGVVNKLKNLFQPQAAETQTNKDVWIPIIVIAGCLILVFIILGSGRK